MCQASSKLGEPLNCNLLIPDAGGSEARLLGSLQPPKSFRKLSEGSRPSTPSERKSEGVVNSVLI